MVASRAMSDTPITPVATTAAPLVAGLVLKPTSGVHFGTNFQIDASAPSGTYYLHLVQGGGDAVPPDGSYTGNVSLLHAPVAVAHNNGTTDSLNLSEDSDAGALFSGGLCAVLSTTQFSKTGAAFGVFDGSVQ